MKRWQIGRSGISLLDVPVVDKVCDCIIQERLQYITEDILPAMWLSKGKGLL